MRGDPEIEKHSVHMDCEKSDYIGLTAIVSLANIYYNRKENRREATLHDKGAKQQEYPSTLTLRGMPSIVKRSENTLRIGWQRVSVHSHG